MILTIIAFVLIFGLIVFVHELGHFLVAKREGMKVREFAFGFPPRIWGKKVGETTYAINAIPLGGYVSILGEDGRSNAFNSFTAKSPWARLRVVLAGVVMNLMLAWILLTIFLLFLPWQPQIDGVVVAQVISGSVAQKVGIKANDIIISAGGSRLQSEQDLIAFTKANRGHEVNFIIKRNGNELNISATLGRDDAAPLGVRIADIDNFPQVPWWQAPWYALVEIGNIIVMILAFLGKLILKLFGFGGVQVSADQVSGPVGIFVFLKQTVSLGLLLTLRFAALLSVAVAIFNVLPFPALDGGRAVFITAEGLFGRRFISHKVEGWIHAAGFLILIILILVVTYFDILKL